MDLSDLDTRQKADAGVDFPLTLDDEIILGDDGKPITFRIRGINTPDVQQHYISAKSKPPAKTPEEVHESDMRLLRSAVCGWSDNVKVAGELVPFSREAIEIVFSIPYVRGFAVGKIVSMRDFMNKA